MTENATPPPSHPSPHPGLRHLWFPYTQMRGAPAPPVAAETDGARITLEDGRELIDGVSSWWTACHGYNHPHIVAAMEAQLRRMPHVMFGGMAHEPAMRLAQRLCALLPREQGGTGAGGGLEHVFFSDSGSVAVEVALKMAVQYWLNRGIEGRTRFVAFRHGYHGDTLGAMSVCDPDEGMHNLFKGYLPEQFIRDLPRGDAALADFAAFLKANAGRIAGVIMEPLVQAAGGMKFHDAETLAAIRRACTGADVLFIADEIATGFGRTGHMFACAEAGIVPDIICVGKALTGGAMTLAATVTTDAVYEAFLSDDPEKALMHGPTYMANPLGCAAANASLGLFEAEPRLEQVAAIEAHLAEALESCRTMPGVVDVRVKGAIGVVQLDRIEDPTWFRRRFIDEGVWIRPFGDIVYLMPPFVVSEAELARLTGAVVSVVGEWGQTAPATS